MPEPVIAAEADTLLEQLRALLDAQDPPLPQGSRIALTVSDTVANVVAMPWQATLQRAAEVEAYAHACFLRVGASVGDGWAMHAEFRNMDAMGMAYALPDAWLEAVLAELAPRQLALATVLPLSAALYFGARPRHGAWPAVLVAREQARYVACVFGPNGLAGYDVEPIVGQAADSARRLEERITAQFGRVPRRAVWNASTGRDGDSASLGLQPWQAAA